MTSWRSTFTFIISYFLMGAVVIGLRIWYVIPFNDGAWMYADVLPQLFVIMLVAWMFCLPFIWLTCVGYEVISSFFHDSNNGFDLR